MNELRGLVDVPHEIGEVAAARIARLGRRLRAVERLLRRVPAWHLIGPITGSPRTA